MRTAVLRLAKTVLEVSINLISAMVFKFERINLYDELAETDEMLENSLLNGPVARANSAGNYTIGFLYSRLK